MTMAVQIALGVVLAAALIGAARWLGWEAAAYRVVLVATAGFYVLAALGRARGALPLELVGLALFGGMALLARPGRGVLLLAAGWAGHALWDAAFQTGGRGGYVPDWYPIVCLGFDLFLAGYLAGLAVERRRGEGGAG